jgi:DNA mismatch endonuclease (patch repair protein)
MVDTISRRKRSEVMRRVRSHGNASTELRLAALLRAHRVTGWRRQQTLPGRPDFVFHREKLCVFVDGCFWHGCPRHYREPTTRVAFWRQKVARNRRRDREVNRALRAAGWRIVRIWECGLAGTRQARALARIRRALRAGPRKPAPG